ncbi:MAG: alkaline phosphatase D family protein [Schleiferiaceae bacterium]|nr:alkaline phosphatase D family protein [Schleiferiaceae bacterium]
MNLRHIWLTLFLTIHYIFLGQGTLQSTTAPVRSTTYKTNTQLSPFSWGVASGDPTHESVVLWTKVEGDGNNPVHGIYRVALDTGFTQVIHSGTFSTGPQMNYTVKLNVNGLNADTHYYYHFSALNANSLTGRTKTLPSGLPSAGHLKLGVISCQNYEHGYFNILHYLANKNELDAIVHLGDYIYEYKNNATIPGREHDSTEAVSLAEYRQRYDLYKSDTSLIRLHQQYPFIQIWDDHEVADNAWMNGADNHNPNSEGPWNIRKSAGYQAFYEYQPMWPGQDSSVYRTLSLGALADLILWDTRFVGREKQIYDVSDSAVYDSSRTLLGSTQFNWAKNELQASTAQWKLIGNQVFFSPFHMAWAAVPPETPHSLESALLDMWDGYPMERKKIIAHLQDQQIDNTVFLTGDFHSAFAAEVADPVCDTGNGYAPVPDYNPQTGAGSAAVEFVTPSVSSNNFDERIPAWASAILETQFTSPLPNGNVANPHFKYVDLDRHGGIVLSIDAQKVQADYYYTSDKLNPTDSGYFDKGLFTLDGTQKLSVATGAYPVKPNQAIPAPGKPHWRTLGLNEQPIVVSKVYPNPTSDLLKIELANKNALNVEVRLYNLVGVVFYAHTFAQAKSIEMNVQDIPEGVYFLAIKSNGQTHIQQVHILK